MKISNLQLEQMIREETMRLVEVSWMPQIQYLKMALSMIQPRIPELAEDGETEHAQTLAQISAQLQAIIKELLAPAADSAQ